MLNKTKASGEIFVGKINFAGMQKLGVLQNQTICCRSLNRPDFSYFLKTWPNLAVLQNAVLRFCKGAARFRIFAKSRF